MLSNRQASEEGVLGLLRTVAGPGDDIFNQAIVLNLIERFWRVRPPKRPIETLHAAISGKIETGSIRRTKVYVPDFGGAPPSTPSDVAILLPELELFAERLVLPLSDASLSARAEFLAHMFSAIIRIHPFEDGNGRAARYFVQLCTMAWTQTFIPIPKLMNDKRWASALRAAVDGNTAGLAGEFRRRLS